jgi:predicted transcriptional regulator
MVKAADKNVIMISIHPQFAQAIFRGEKTIEFRKLNVPKHVEYVVLYVTAPQSKIAGYFSVKGVVEDLAIELWNKFRNVSGTTEDFFFQYYGKDGTGRGFLVDKVHILANPITLDAIKEGAKPPQSFTYVDGKMWGSLKRRKKSMQYLLD